MKDGDFLFSLKHNNKEAIAESSFSAKVKKFSKRVIWYFNISMRFIRISWATILYSSNPTAKQIKKLSAKMSPSPQESRLYNKVE